LAEHKADSGWPRTVRTDENINLYNEHALSQEDAPPSYTIFMCRLCVPIFIDIEVVFAKL